MSNYGSIYLPKQTIEIPQSNDANLVFDFQDQTGALLDLTGVSEIEFVVFDEQNGTAEIEKTLSGGDIVIYGNNYQFQVTISKADTLLLTNRLSYHECEVTNSGGETRTVSAGLFRCENTSIWRI